MVHLIVAKLATYPIFSHNKYIKDVRHIFWITCYYSASRYLLHSRLT